MLHSSYDVSDACVYCSHCIVGLSLTMAVAHIGYGFGLS